MFCDPGEFQWNSVLLLQDQAAREADGHEGPSAQAGTQAGTAGEPNTLFFPSKPAHMRWGSPANKFPKKTYGAYLLRKTANKTNWEGMRGKADWVFQSHVEVRFRLEDMRGAAVPTQVPDRGAPEPSPTQTAPTSLGPLPTKGRPGKSIQPLLPGVVTCIRPLVVLWGLTPSRVRKEPWGKPQLISSRNTYAGL